MHRLPTSTVKLITSTQVITSANSVVKELLENSLDAGATSIEIKLDNFGFDKIEVRDNGCGVSKDDIQYMAVPHYTSKLTSTEDLECLNTYGFRGEALGSLCSVSDVTVTTKTVEYDISTEYSLDHKGQIVGSKPSHLGQGTTISVANIFKNLPVRKQFHNSAKRKKATLKEIEDLVLSYGIVCPNVRFVLRHNKDLLWQKNPVSSSKMVLHTVLGSSVMNHLQYVQKVNIDPEITIEGYLPKYGSNATETGRSNTDRSFIYVNSRPVILKNVEKILKQYYSAGHNLDPPKHPVGFLHVKIPSKEVDVNLDPNKTKVMLHHKEELQDILKCLLEELYTVPKSEVPTSTLDICKEVQNSNLNNAPDLPNMQTDQSDQFAEDLIPTVQMNIISGTKPSEEKEQSYNVSAIDLFEEELEEELLLAQDTSVSKTDPIRQTAILEEIVENNYMSECKKDSYGDKEQSCTKSNVTEIDGLNVLGDTHSETNTLSISTLNNYIDASHRENTPSDIVPEVKANTDCTDGNGDVNCNVSVNSSSEKLIKSVVYSVSNSLSSVNKKPNFNVSADFDDILSMDIDTPEKATVEVQSPDWCKGTSVSDNNSGIIQPVQLLMPEKKRMTFSDTQMSSSTSSPGLSTSIRKTKVGHDMLGQATLYDVMSTVKRPTTAYIFFSKEIRPKVVQENPNCSFEEIAKVIGEKWKSLLVTERQKYEELMTKDVERYKEQKSLVTTSKNIGVPAKKRKTEMNSPCIQKLFASKKKSPSSSKPRSPVKTVTVQFSMGSFKERRDSLMKNSQQWELSHNNFQIIGPVKSLLLWVVIKSGKLQLFQPVRAKELLIYRGLLENHELPLEKQDSPVILTKSVINDSMHWQTLLSMKKSPGNCYTYYTDERLVKNGFSIRQYWDQSSEDIKIEIESITNCMNFFGTGDLIAILDLISKNSTQDGTSELSNCRTTKIQHYLQGEAVRMSRKIPPKFSQKECKDLLDCVMHENITSCFHKRPFLVSIYDFTELPSTQRGSQI